MSQTDAALFLTATPVMISTENLYNLLHLLDNTRYYNYQILTTDWRRTDLSLKLLQILIIMSHCQLFLIYWKNLKL